MGAGQVLRAQVAAALIAAVAAASPAAPLAAGVIDLRAPGELPEATQAVASVLRGIDGVRLPVDERLGEALAGHTPQLQALATARARRREAMAAYAELRCSDAAPLAESAALAFLATAEPAAVRDELAHLLAIMLLCAHQAGDHAAGFAAAERLRGLAFDGTPPGVPDEVWARYPEADVLSNRQTVPVQIVTTPDAGARVWIDLREVGVTPIDLRTEPGRHWVSVASGERHAAAAFDARAKMDPLSLDIGPENASDNPWLALREQVAGWRIAGRVPDEKDLAGVMRAAGLVLTVVLVQPEAGEAEAQVWVLPEGSPTAVLVGTAKITDSPAISRTVQAGVDRLAPSSGAPVAPVPAAKKSTGWGTWAFLGVIVVGAAAVFLASEAGDTTQRIEVSFP